jgi:hypothetical protein
MNVRRRLTILMERGDDRRKKRKQQKEADKKWIRKWSVQAENEPERIESPWCPGYEAPDSKETTRATPAW